MALTFRPNRAVYHSASGVVRFFATHGLLFVRCGVSKDALIAINGACPEGAALERIYMRHLARIQKIADRKHRAGQVDKDGMIVVHEHDLLAQQRTFPRRPARGSIASLYRPSRRYAGQVHG
jgi:Protein of unknown function (DUF1488)